MVAAIAINFQGELHMFHTELQMIVDHDFLGDMSEDERKEMLDEKKLSYLYEGTIGVIDRSSENIPKLFQVYLFSNEQRAQFYPSALIEQLVEKAPTDNERKHQIETKHKIEAKLRNLVEKSSFTNTVFMLLEPIKTEKLIFRLVHTIFE
jgi:hypothetical protein